MSLKIIIASSTVALALAGCAQSESTFDETGTNEQALGVAPGPYRCPDPTNDCLVYNGPGIYTEEGGYAGMGAGAIQITHFINLSGGGVEFDGIYSPLGSNGYAPLPSLGKVVSATYAGAKYKVLGVRESATVPTWALSNGNGVETDVTAGQLLNLVLHVSVDDGYPGDAPKAYVPPPLDKEIDIIFTAGGIDRSTNDGHQLPIEFFNMAWRFSYEPNDPSNLRQYCTHDVQHLGPTQPFRSDQVVFQGSIGVDPFDATVTRNSTSASWVTLSCRAGAIATVHQWGYGYRTGYNPGYFDAGLQMKRASYCGDSSYYTVAGTGIVISDNDSTGNGGLGVQIPAAPIRPIEAYWSPKGALCLNYQSMRYPNANFSGSCNGQPLPDCSTFPQASSWLADGAKGLQGGL